MAKKTSAMIKVSYQIRFEIAWNTCWLWLGQLQASSTLPVRLSACRLPHVVEGKEANQHILRMWLKDVAMLAVTAPGG